MTTSLPAKATDYGYPERCAKCYSPAGTPCRTKTRNVTAPHVGRLVEFLPTHPYFG